MTSNYLMTIIGLYTKTSLISKSYRHIHPLLDVILKAMVGVRWEKCLPELRTCFYSCHSAGSNPDSA